MVNDQMGATYESKAWRKWFQQEGTIIMDRIDGHDPADFSEPESEDSPRSTDILDDPTEANDDP